MIGRIRGIYVVRADADPSNVFYRGRTSRYDTHLGDKEYIPYRSLIIYRQQASRYDTHLTDILYSKTHI